MIIGEGGEADRHSLKLSTCLGSHIPNVRSPERHPESLRAAISLWGARHPNAELRSISATYNCMGMVFGTRRTCIDVDSLDLVLREDSYQRLDSLNSAKVGDIVVYQNTRGVRTHVGFIIRISAELGGRRVYILSKWGHDGEYVHEYADVPEIYGRVAEIWTDRRLP